ncbi:hypothetical protein BU24DRAFT_497934 [Aaosphaeria arxii CBS 175.79]|uniref:Pyoverdine/dityrosine biosynthesis protein n=1 Tax=Aaosphaeria arxii CBS 175.79 TaxID=1450172 RepID=A0A6A5X6A4_9PLEO|nr:uncharacterized protein BU24DRAFT_497934 [Aaosphaeria arxii CBS 175.79]KAF2008483.1 hypothetical protein BU24DRAFT_497934 [Aaosphaeria arxii CBS 175.79]
MPALNKGTSTYHSVHGLYWRNASGELLAVEGSNSQTLPQLWTSLRAEILDQSNSWSRQRLPSGKEISTLHIKAQIPELTHIRANFPPNHQDEELVTKVAEVQHADGLILGMLTSRPKSLAADKFGLWAENFVLLETQFRPFAQLTDAANHEHRAIVEKVATIFETKLKNASRDDQWNVTGRNAFMNRVYGFVERNIPILLALPAFPCKSPNSNKVGGTMPDLAEHIALDVLRDFVKEVNKIYAPGATMWVISDGHVFSDCIGVDDGKVDTYDAQLIEVYKKKFPVEEGPVPAIQFKGLKDIFMSNPDSFASFSESMVAEVNVPHPVKTELTAPSELCRKLLLSVSEADRGFIRQCIEEQEPHALQLYRGQTRFMLEDLAMVPSVINLSNKQKKKTAALVAQEMISRNQAYSNLVELLLPNYVRLSIHAHNNKGPKFAVRLLPKSLVRPIESLLNRHEPVPAYEFQIPTPWHNSIIKVEGDDLMYLARADVARVAIKTGTDFEGSWVDGPNGAYFHLTRKPGITKAISPLVTSEKALLQKRRPTISLLSPIEKPVLHKRSTIIIRSPLQEKSLLALEPSLNQHALKFFLPFSSFLTFTSFFQTLWRNVAEGVY